ncbi:MAG: sulfotransferase [Oricola sp.]
MGTALSVDQALRKAKSLARKGEIVEAQRLYREVLDRFPDNKRALEGLQELGQPRKGQRGTPLTQQQINGLLALFNRGRMQEALAQGRALITQHPHVAGLHNIVGACLFALGQSEQAVASYRQALTLEPDSTDVLTSLAAALQALHRDDEATIYVDKALTLNPQRAEALNNLGGTLNALGRSQEAVAVLDKALTQNPRFVEALNNRGNALTYIGRQKEAIADLERAIALRPNYADAHRSLSLIKKYAPGDPQIAQMERILPSVGPADASLLHFALAKAHDDAGDTDRAFGHFAKANSLGRQKAGDAMTAQKAHFSAIRSLFENGVPAPLDVEPATRRPIFILGMPRSGTSLVEQILASHPQVHGAGELPFLSRATEPAVKAGAIDPAALEGVRQRYLDSLDTLGFQEPVVTDKMPMNFRFIGYIAAALPEATIIHTRRDPVAVGWSIYRTFFPARGLDFSTDLSDIAAYYRLYEDLMAFWSERLPGRIHDIDYEALTENQEAETRRLLDLCGLDWDERVIDFHRTERTVTTASSMQVREKMYTGSSQDWRRYEKHLGPLIEGLR